MTTATPKLKYVQPDRDKQGRLVAAGTLKKGLCIDSVYHKEFVMHAANTGELLDTEMETSTSTPLNYNTALIARTMDRIGSYDGAVTLGMMRSLSSIDLNILRHAQGELDLAGEVEQ